MYVYLSHKLMNYEIFDFLVKILSNTGIFQSAKFSDLCKLGFSEAGNFRNALVD